MENLPEKAKSDVKHNAHDWAEGLVNSSARRQNEMAWIEVTEVNQVPVGRKKSFSVEGKEVLIANYEGTYYALDNICPHAGGHLSDGTLEGNIVTCPRHGSKFDITTGKGISGPKLGPFNGKVTDIEVFEIKTIDDKIKINLASGE